MALLLILSSFILFRMDYSRQMEKIQSQSRMKLDFIAEMTQYMESIQESSISTYDVHLQKDLSFLSRFPADHTADDKYSQEHPIESQEEDHYAYLSTEEFQNIIKQSFDGILMLVSTTNEEPAPIWQAITFSDTDNVPAPDITKKMITEQQQIIKASGSNWLCTCLNLKNGSTALIYLLPLRSVIMRCVYHIALAELSALIIFVTILAYFFSVIKYSKTHLLTKQETVIYHPKNLRRKMITSGLTGALFMFSCMAVFQTMDALYEESFTGAKTISQLLEYVGKTVSYRIADEKQRESECYVSHGELIASRIAQAPESVSRKELQEYCDLFDIDYIMLFDPKGKETLSSAGYVGFTMDAGLGKNSGDFRRLLRGIPYIIHDVSYDPVTELERQFIGVRVPSQTKSGEPVYGALLMAIIPHMETIEDIDIIGQFHFPDKKNRSFFYTDQETGLIRYASDSSLVGKTVMECGLPEKSLQDGYTDFASFNGVNSYITMVKQETVNFFYVIRSAALFNSTLPLAAASAICYLITFVILCWFCLKDYNVSVYEAMLGSEKQKPKELSAAEFDNYSDTSIPDYSKLVVSKNRSDTRWSDKTPETQVETILKIDILLLVFLPALVLLRLYGDSTLFSFIMKGNWMRGLNLLSFCAVVIITTIGILVVVLCNGLLSMIAGFTGRSGETMCRMLYSLINYMVVMFVLYYVFEYIGLPMGTYIASVSAASLAISIGAQGMVSDILAGAMILFEHQFQVGDIVEIEGFRGRILEIGVRSTRLLSDDNDIRFINNSTIRNIVNKSIHNTTNIAEFNLFTKKSLEEIEELFNRELPNIGKKSDDIIRGPVLNGIVKVSRGISPKNNITFTLQIEFECLEQDNDKVRTFITREVFLLCEREGIGLNFGLYNFPSQRRYDA